MKRTIPAFLLLSLACARGAHAQGHPVDWPLFGGDAQRSGWEKADSRITRDNVKDFRLVLKQKLDGGANGSRSLSAPVIIGTLISYRGFKELAFVSGSSDHFWALDADLERMFWQRHFETGEGKHKGHGGSQCLAAATPSLIPPVNFGARRPPRPSGSTKSPGPPATPAGAPGVNKKGAVPGILSAGGFGSPRPVFALATDGKLHLLNTSTGEDVAPPLQFIPAGARASSLTFADGFLYTATTGNCGGVPDAIWSIDLSGAGSEDPPVVAHYVSESGSLPPLAGLAIGSDGTVYTRTNDGSVIALGAKQLKLAQSFQASGSPRKTSLSSAAPLVFTYKETDFIVSPTADGGLALLDSESLSKPVYQTEPLTSAGHGIWGGLSSWQDADGTRWIYAPVWGPTGSSLSKLTLNGEAPHGSIVALKLEEREGKPVLTPAWVSPDMQSPEPPVITDGIVFALSAGKYAADEHRKPSGHATLHAFDAATGKEMYSTGDQVTVPASLSGVTLANGRVYFTTVDNTLYAFGVYLER